MECVNKYRNLMKSWDFDLWDNTEDELFFLALHMFEERGFLEVFSIPRETFIRFLYNVRKGYRVNNYHNWRHAVDVSPVEKKKRERKEKLTLINTNRSLMLPSCSAINMAPLLT
jgi:hypothetical protein